MRSKELGLFISFLFFAITAVIIIFNSSFISTQCIPQTCDDLGFECSIWNDGCGGTVDCGTCTPKLFCSGGSCFVPANCVPFTCEELNYSCGTPSNGCGGTLSCGSCDSGESCASGQCVANIPCSSQDQLILRLSDSTNAHAEVFDGAGNYSVEICYDTIFGVAGSGDRSCTGSNKVVGLSDLTNAHAEEPSLSNYATDVCYGGLSCTARTGACRSGESLVLSLSSSTNAHLTSDSSYFQNICCSIGPLPPSEDCTITFASWSRSGEVIERTIVDMIITGDDCDGEPVDFSIAETDCIFGTCNYGDIDNEDTAELIINQISGSFSGTQAVVSWTTEWVKDDNNGFGDDDPEYVFKAELSNDASINIDESGELKVTPLPLEYCDFVVLCGSYYTDTSGDPTAENACNADVCEVAELNAEIKEGVECDDADTNCFCEWNTSESLCKSIWEIESPPSSPEEAGRCTYTETTTGSCDTDGFLNSSWTATWTGSNPNAACADGQKAIICPAQVQLAFFNLYNMLITLLAIAGIYGILSLRKKP